MKSFLFVIFLLTSFYVCGQVTSVDYLMKYNCETNQYDVHIVIVDGSATTIPQRAQFNSQISFVVPTGTPFNLSESYMPLRNNQLYNSNEPLEWSVSPPLVSPSVQPESDFYGITPILSPASFYNDLATGDIVKIFSLDIGESGEYDENVRLYDNDNDPTSQMVSMGMGNFSNGFTLGGATQLFNDSYSENCVTNTQFQTIEEINVYPNPFQDQLSIQLPEGTVGVSVLNMKGDLLYEKHDVTAKEQILNTFDFPQGVYIIQLTNTNGAVYSKRVLKF